MAFDQAFDIEVTNADWLLLDVVAAAVEPAPPVDYLAWAETNIVFSERESPFPGPYNRDLFPYFDEILRALSPEDPCRIVTVSKSAQLGGTVLANIFTGGSMDMAPGDFLYVHPTEENARRWSKMKLSPMLKGTSALRNIFPMKPRDGLDSVLYKERRDGRGAIQISGANSPASLSQVSMTRQVQDDLAKWEMNAAGDPESQADSRSQSREFAKILKVSTPMVMPGCRISANYESGSREKPYVPCPHCGHMQVLDWENMLANLDEDRPEKACFVCEGPECGGVIEEHHRKEMLAGLEWRADDPKAKRVHRSFWIWSAYSVLQSWERIARSWISAKGDPAKEQTFMNDVVGLPFRVLGDAPSWEKLRDRGQASDHARGTVPAGFPKITMGIDCQGDRVEFQFVAWGPDKRRAVVDFDVIQGHISDEACQKKLTAQVNRTFRNVYGREVPVERAAIDGNAYTEDVWEWARKHPASKVIMVRGVGQETAPLFVRVKRETDRRGKKKPWSRRFYNFATSVLKMALYRNFRKEDPQERGHVLLPSGLDDEFYRQITAESRKGTKNRSGFMVYKWVKDPNQANEGLDTHLQAEAASIHAGIRTATEGQWDEWLAEWEREPAPVQGDFEDLLRALPAAAKPTESEVAPGDDASGGLREKFRRRTS